MAIINPETVLRFSGYHLDQAAKTLHKIQVNVKDYRAWHTEKKWKIVEHHLRNNAFYKAHVGNKPVNAWTDIPVLKKADYQQSLIHMISNGFSKRQLYVANTSGSTGQPFIYAKDKFCHALAWAMIQQLYRQQGIQLKSLQARFYGIPLKGKSAIAERMKDKLMNRVRFPVFDLSVSQLKTYVDKFRLLPFEYIYGYTNAIRHFCRYLVDEGITLKTLCPSLKCVIVTAEMCTAYDRSIVEQGTGVPCIVEYGSSETGVIGFEQDGLMQATDELLFLEVEESGSLLITSLFNKAFPMIRYQIGDEVELDCNFKNGRTIINKIMGRSDDLIKLPGNRVAAGLTMYYISRNLLDQMSRIKEMYVTQTHLSSFKIFYIGEPLNKKEEEMIRQSFDAYLQPGLNLEIIRTEAIRRKASGKLQMFHSELSN